MEKMFFLIDSVGPKLRNTKKLKFFKCDTSTRGLLISPIFLYFVFISLMLTIYVLYPMNSGRVAKDLGEEPKMRKIQTLEVEQMLTDAFNKADLNRDFKLTLQEVARYINAKIRDHIEDAIQVNPLDFAEIDISPKDGLISWEEYQGYFLKTKGYSGDFQEGNPSYVRIQKDKRRWRDAARTDSFGLTLDEFFAFRHPEASAASLLSLVDDLLRQFDENGDENITMEEFSTAIAEDLDDKWRVYMIDKTKYQKEEEFKRLMDKNKDGKADRTEVVAYLDPRHPRYALVEAAEIFSHADGNKDKRLTLKEVLKASESISTSLMVDVNESFHENFQLQ